MDSMSEPCSGFVTVDGKGTPCAGFRECGSHNGTTKLNPAAHTWDVPLEIRCATNADLTTWAAPEYLYPVYYYRGLPYDPVRPWKDLDGKWYSTISTDGCNSTTKKVPCALGGQLDLWVSDALHGPKANWKHTGAMFTSPKDVLPGVKEEREFVTSGYFGAIPGDPAGGATRVFTNGGSADSGTTEFYIGLQGNGSKFVLGSEPSAVGMIDWGSFSPTGSSSKGISGLEGKESRGQSMCRTLGSDPDQVAVPGRRVIVCWLGGTPAQQSLSRDVTLSPKTELLQQFVP